MGYTFMVPAKIISGTNVIEELGQHIQGKGTKALIVTDQFMVKFGNAAKVENALAKANIPYVTFAGANSEPTDKIVDAGLKVYREEGCDFLVALGGGSPMDTAKAIMFMSTQPEGKKINEFMHVNIDMPVRISSLSRRRLARALRSRRTQSSLIRRTTSRCCSAAHPSSRLSLLSIRPSR